MIFTTWQAMHRWTVLSKMRMLGVTLKPKIEARPRLDILNSDHQGGKGTMNNTIHEQNKEELCAIYDRINDAGKRALMAVAYGFDTMPMYAANVIRFPVQEASDGK